MEHSALSLSQADRLHELISMLKALQDITDAMLQDAKDADVCFGVYLVFQMIIDGFEALQT